MSTSTPLPRLSITPRELPSGPELHSSLAAVDALPPGAAAALLACAAVTFALFGTTYAFAAFFPAVAGEFGAGRGEVSVPFAVAGFLSYAVGAFSGALADRYGAPRLVAVGMVVAAAGLLMAGAAGSLAVVQAAYGLGLGIGIGIAFVPIAGLAQTRWPRNPGFGAGVAAAGSAAGTLLVPQAAAWLVRLQGWRGACATLAAFVLAVCLAAVPVIWRQARGPRNAPAGLGSGTTARRRLGGAFAQARMTSDFRRIYLGALCASTGAFIPFLHLPAFARDHGVNDAQAMALIGCIGLGGLVGRLGFGVITGYLGHRVSFGAVAAGMMAALLWWWAAPATGWALVAFSLAFGAFYGGYMVILPVLATAYLPGPNAFGAIGLMLTSHGIGMMVGPVAAGLAYDTTGGYGAVILAAAALNLVPITCALRIGPPTGP